jgi:SprT protein
MTQELKDQIMQAATIFIAKYNQATGKEIPIDPGHKFDLKGKVAGQFCFRSTGSYLRWNLQAAKKYTTDYMTQTVGHEVAHYIAFQIDKRAQAHGTLWKAIMWQLGLPTNRCHAYNLAPARTVTKPFKYICPCGVEMNFTVKKYQNMILRGLKEGGKTYYYCKKCHTYINILKITHSDKE